MYGVIYKKHKKTGQVLYYHFYKGCVEWSKNKDGATRYDEAYKDIDEIINILRGVFGESWELGKSKVYAPLEEIGIATNYTYDEDKIMYQVIYKKHKETGEVLYYCSRPDKIELDDKYTGWWDEEVEEAVKYDLRSNTIDKTINNLKDSVDEIWILGKKTVGVSEWERDKNNFMMVKISTLESIYSIINESLRRLKLPKDEANYTKEEVARYLKHAEKEIIPFIRGDQSGLKK